jgi:glycosyltransferase 2 family protein
MTIAQVAYILVGISLGFWLFLPPQDLYLSILAILASLGLVLFGIALLVMVQRRGLFTVLFTLLRKCRVRIAPLEAQRHKLFALDQAVLAFYSRSRGAFLLSTAAFLVGWLVEAVEVYLMLRYLGAPIDPLTALSIDALSTFIKGATFVVPGSVRAQKAGNLMLVTAAYGQCEVIGMTFALLRRLRELVWVALGLVCLALLRSGACPRRSTGQ